MAARAKYKIEKFVGAMGQPDADKFFWRIKAGGRIVLTSGEGIARRNTRDRIAQGLFDAMKPGTATMVDLQPKSRRTAY